MKRYTTDQIRDVALAGHTSSGKTSLAEALLFYLKMTDRQGRVKDGNTVSDYDPEEVKRRTSINATLLPLDLKEVKINLLDLPGYRDFVGEIRNCLRAADAVMLVVDAASGVEVGTEFAWEIAEEFALPIACFVNKLDKERSNLAAALASLDENFGKKPVLLNLPIGAEAAFSGVVDLLRMKAVREENHKAVYEEIPEALRAEAEQRRAQLIEAAAEGDDELTLKFLEEEALSDEEVQRGLRLSVLQRRFLPVLCGSATKTVGLQPLLDFVISCFPAPTEGSEWACTAGDSDEVKRMKVNPEGTAAAFVFKTVSDPYAGHLTFFKTITGEVHTESVLLNPERRKEERITHLLAIRGKKQENVHRVAAGDIGVVAKLMATGTHDTLCDPKRPVRLVPPRMPQAVCQMALVTENKTDEEKIGLAMHRLIEQDPTLSLRRDAAVRQTILSGMGDMHLEVAVSRLQTYSNVAVRLTEPRVPYRETITGSAEGQGKFKKQTGGRGQYGDCWIRLEPMTEGGGFQFEWGVVGGVIPTKYQPSVEKGLIESLDRGIVAGYPVVDVKATCYDGSYHTVDSSDIAFKVAASMAFKNVAVKARPIILEPICYLKVTVPESYMGDVMGNLSSKRGRILGNMTHGRKAVIEAEAPQAEVFTYSRELRSLTQGRGVFEMEFRRYEAVTPDIQAKIVEAAAQRKEEES